MGQDPLNRIGLWEKMFHSLYNRNEVVGLGGSAISAIDIALWDINGKYSQQVDLFTRAVDMLPLIETTAPSKFTIEGEYAQVVPNPNPLGQAFLDDFESSKMTISPSIMDNHWKIASPPVDSTKDIYNRGTMYWYNPYQDIDTKEIWPNKETSSRAGNNTTKTLVLASEFSDEVEWNGITTNFYEGSTNQSDKKFMEIWLNSVSYTHLTLPTKA